MTHFATINTGRNFPSESKSLCGRKPQTVVNTFDPTKVTCEKCLAKLKKSL